MILVKHSNIAALLGAFIGLALAAALIGVSVAIEHLINRRSKMKGESPWRKL